MAGQIGSPPASCASGTHDLSHTSLDNLCLVAASSRNASRPDISALKNERPEKAASFSRGSILVLWFSSCYSTNENLFEGLLQHCNMLLLMTSVSQGPTLSQANESHPPCGCLCQGNPNRKDATAGSSQAFTCRQDPQPPQKETAPENNQHVSKKYF